jgi:asparagine synthetase B (glutamine-hydrolysing)
MIFGYISKGEHPRVESYIKEKYPDGVELACQYKEGKAWFFTNNMHFDFCQYYYDENNVLLFEGVPIRGFYNTGYEIIDAIRKPDLDRGFLNLIEEIVSNVSIAFFRKEDLRLHLASDRANTNRIYYRYIDGGGLMFSSSFSILSHLDLSKINYEAIYSILKYGCIPPPLSPSEQIYVVPPAHYIVFNSSKPVFESPYFKFSFTEEHGANLDTLNTILNTISEVLSQLSGSLLLSGGVDSTLLAHKIHEQSTSTIRAYFLALDKGDPENIYAEEAARSTNSHLDVIFMDEGKLSEIIYEIAESYDYPFNDFSTIPTYFLFREVVNKGERILIDGTGGDGCFGFGTIGPDKLPYVIAYSLPIFIKRMSRLIYSQSSFWKKESALEKAFRTIAKYYEVDDVNLGPLMIVPSNDIFPIKKEYNESAGKLIVNLIDTLIKPASLSRAFEERATVADIIFNCGAKMAEKTHLREKFPCVHVLYPFLWRDILEEQSKISWSAKVNNGTVKWPLKKLLEAYMPPSFVYRKKSGLTPNLESYVKNNYQLLKDTLKSRNDLSFFFEKDQLDMLIEKLLDIDGYSLSLCHLLWGILFTSLWVKKNFNA